MVATIESPPSAIPTVIHIFSEDNHPRGYVLKSDRISIKHGSRDLQAILGTFMILFFNGEITGKITIATFPPPGFKGNLNRTPSPLSPEDILTIRSLFSCEINTKE